MHVLPSVFVSKRKEWPSLDVLLIKERNDREPEWNGTQHNTLFHPFLYPFSHSISFSFIYAVMCLNLIREPKVQHLCNCNLSFKSSSFPFTFFLSRSFQSVKQSTEDCITKGNAPLNKWLSYCSVGKKMMCMVFISQNVRSKGAIKRNKMNKEAFLYLCE